MKTFFVMVGILTLAIILGGSMGRLSHDWANAQGTNPTFASSSYQSNIVVSTNTLVVAYDNSNIDWFIHPENGAIRCTSGLYNGNPPQVPPTTTVGFEFTSGGYFGNLPFTPPQLSVYCTAESGSVNVSLWVDHR